MKLPAIQVMLLGILETEIVLTGSFEIIQLLTLSKILKLQFVAHSGCIAKFVELFMQ